MLAASRSVRAAGWSLPAAGRRLLEGDAAGPADTTAGRTVVREAQQNTQLDNPADPAAATLLERVQDAFRPAFTTGHAYHYAEDSARAVVAEQQASGAGGPGVESMYAPVGAVGDEVTAPRSWHFSNRSDQLDEARQAELAADAQAKQGT